jgi:hypothetical protein
MVIPKVGSRVATLVAAEIAKSSGPAIATRAGMGHQAIYNYRDGRLPSRWVVPALARGLKISVRALTDALEADRRDRASLRQAGVA